METYYVETYYGMSLTNWIWFLAFSENFGVDIHLRTFGSFVWNWRLDIPSSLTTLVSGHQEINGIAKCLLFCDCVALMSRNTCWNIIYVYIIFTIIYIYIYTHTVYTYTVYIYKHMCIHIVVPHESHSANEFPWVLVSILPRSSAFQSWQAMVVAPFSIKSDLPVIKSTMMLVTVPVTMPSWFVEQICGLISGSSSFFVCLGWFQKAKTGHPWVFAI